MAMLRAAGMDEEVPVLIVGGGAAGLTASMLLARLGVDHLLISALPHTSDLPKAHVLNQRAVEVLDDVGVADAVAERGTPPANMAATAYYAGFAGPGADYGRRSRPTHARHWALRICRGRSTRSRAGRSSR
jgi:2,4-dichlorophenol 6-monooxygenase